MLCSQSRCSIRQYHSRNYGHYAKQSRYGADTAQLFFNHRLPDWAGWRGGSDIYVVIYYGGMKLEYRPGYRLCRLRFSVASLNLSTWIPGCCLEIGYARFFETAHFAYLPYLVTSYDPALHTFCRWNSAVTQPNIIHQVYPSPPITSFPFQNTVNNLPPIVFTNAGAR
jgi:hypothetical protein